MENCDKNKYPRKLKEGIDTELTNKHKKLEEMQMRVKKLREERVAKHAARIEMLKKMNLEKYSEKNQGNTSTINVRHTNVSMMSKPSTQVYASSNVVSKPLLSKCIKQGNAVKSPAMKNHKYSAIQSKINCPSSTVVKTAARSTSNVKLIPKNTPISKAPLYSATANKSFHSIINNYNYKQKPKVNTNPRLQLNNAIGTHNVSTTSHQLPKAKVTPHILQTHKQNKNVSLNNATKKAESNKNKTARKTISVVEKPRVEMRRSLSTVHFRRMGPEAVKRCMRRTYSVGNFKHNEVEDEFTSAIPFKQYTLPVQSERKKSVKFLTPLRKSNTPTLFLNTPKPSELKKRLDDWLHKRGKSLSAYHHLHCFGIHGSVDKNKIEKEKNNEENKENVEVYNDDSFEELITGVVKDNAAEWRRASYTLVDSPNNMTSDAGPAQSPSPTNQLTGVGALENLHQLILEGYWWQQCAQWLDAIVRHCGDVITKTAQYWECRAALEDNRGDFPRAVECYNKAILQGAQPTQVEESLDHLLHKFMKLNLDPDKKPTQAPDPKFLDVKNVFKSTLIRFAIQQKNIAESKEVSKTLINKYVATPVRRSSRLSCAPDSMKSEKAKEDPGKPKSACKSTGRKHLVQLCTTLQSVNGEIKDNLVFIPNKALNFNDL